MRQGSVHELGEQLVDAIARVARTLGAASSASQEQTAALVVDHALQTVPGAEHAAISLLDKEGAITSHAPSSDLARRLDQLQSSSHEGPCVTALLEQQTVLVDDLAAETTQWPTFAPDAVTYGVHSVLSFQLFTSSDARGTLNLYSSRRAGFDIESLVLGGALTSQATLALGRAHQVENLQLALASRDVIGQAKGILMERHGLDATAAFDLLVRSSQETNTKVIDISRCLVHQLRSRR